MRIELWKHVVSDKNVTVSLRFLISNALSQLNSHMARWIAFFYLLFNNAKHHVRKGEDNKCLDWNMDVLSDNDNWM